MKNKVKVWLERDKDGSLWLYQSIPLRDEDGCILFCDNIIQLDSSYFPSVKWEDDEPTEAYITLANEPQEQPKHEIDWEQRMAEIAESLFITEQPYINCEEDVEKYAEIAIQRAKLFINKLKIESE